MTPPSVQGSVEAQPHVTAPASEGVLAAEAQHAHKVYATGQAAVTARAPPTPPQARPPTWSDWFKAAGFDNVDVTRGLRFNSADHALDAAAEGGGVLLAYDLLAYDELRTGRLVVPVELTLPTGRGYYLVCQKRRQELPHVKAFRAWIKQEMAASDWSNPTSRIVRDTVPNSLQ